MEMSEDLGDVGYGDGHQRGETVIHRGNSWAILNECAVMNGAHLRKVSVRLPIHWSVFLDKHLLVQNADGNASDQRRQTNNAKEVNIDGKVDKYRPKVLCRLKTRKKFSDVSFQQKVLLKISGLFDERLRN